MPFVKKNDARGPQPPNDTSHIFVGRANELNFFREYILAPEDPVYNILSLYGDGGVGKSTLLTRFNDEVKNPEYKEYCLLAQVDERQATVASMMEKFAEQLPMRSDFRKALTRYKTALRKLHAEQETMQDAVLQRAPDFAGAAVEGVPMIGPLLREGLKMTTAHALQGYRASQALLDVERLEDPIADLTGAFVTDLNRLADTPITLSTQWGKRRRRIVLCFDTFEQLADEAAPWLLDYLLAADLSSNLVLVIAGRMPLERSLPDDPKRWLPYLDQGVIYSFSLASFSEEETRSYLQKRSITDPEHINRIWQLSRGLPLYLSLLTAYSQHSVEVDPTADVVANFLRWIPERDEVKRRLVLDAALFSRPFNQDDLAALTYILESERPSLYRWLIKQPFVHKSRPGGRYSYHELAEDLFSRHLYQISPHASYTTRLALIDYYRTCLTALQDHGTEELHLSGERLALMLAVTCQMFLLPDKSYHLQAVAALLEAYRDTRQNEEITRLLRTLSQDQLYNLANADARSSALALLHYLTLQEEDQWSHDFLLATDNLLGKVASAPTFPPTLLAYIYTNRGALQRKLLNNYQQALEDLNRAIVLDPQSAQAYGNRGLTRRALKQYTEALDDCNTALTLDDTLDEVYVTRGEIYRHLQDYQSAIADFDRAIALDPSYAPVYVSRGRIYRSLKRYKQAIEDFNYAIELNPQVIMAYAQRGETYLALNEYEWAINDYTQAISRSPDNFFWAYASRARAHFIFKEYRLAIADYNRAIEINPSYTWAYGQRGKVYRHLKDYQRAIADFDRAIELDHDNAWSYSHRGLSYASLQLYQQAITDITHAIRLNPGYSHSYSHRGGAYLGLNDLERARADYAYNHQLAPDDLRIAWMLTWIELCQGRADMGTAESLAEIAARAPQDPFAHICRGLAGWLRGDLERALVELRQVRAIRPFTWDAFFWEGMILATRADAEAVQMWERALQLGMPPILLTPLLWLQQDQPAFYQRYAVPLLALHGISSS